MKHTGAFPFSTIFIFYIKRINSVFIMCFWVTFATSYLFCLWEMWQACCIEYILMAQCKTAVTPLLMQWSYYSLALNHWYVFLCNICRYLFILLATIMTGMLHGIHIWLVYCWIQPFLCDIHSSVVHDKYIPTDLQTIPHSCFTNMDSDWCVSDKLH